MHAHTQTQVTTHACRSKRVCAPLCEHRCMCEHVYTCVYTHAHSFAPSFTGVLWYSKMKNSNPVQLSPKSMWRIYHSFLSRKLLLRGYVINMLRVGGGVGLLWRTETIKGKKQFETMTHWVTISKPSSHADLFCAHSQKLFWGSTSGGIITFQSR